MRAWRKLPALIAVPILTLTIAACGTAPVATRSHDTSRALTEYYEQWQGTPYAWGGSSPRGIDCSAFVQRVYADVFGIDLPRRTRSQAKLGRKVPRSNLSPGDLVFFRTGWRQRHVGVYVGDGEFIHASESKGVTKSSVQSAYWNKYFWKATRPARG